MFCRKCGKEYTDDLSFCPYCGYVPPSTITTAPVKKRKIFDRSFKIGLLCMGIIFLISFSFSFLTNKKMSQSSPEITVNEYHSIKENMSYEQIKSIVGSSGQEVSRIKDGKYEIVIVKWNGVTPGSSVEVKFQNGVCIAKVQIELE